MRMYKIEILSKCLDILFDRSSKFSCNKFQGFLYNFYEHHEKEILCMYKLIFISMKNIRDVYIAP